MTDDSEILETCDTCGGCENCGCWMEAVVDGIELDGLCECAVCFDSVDADDECCCFETLG